MPDKNPTADCWGGLGASHENGKHARHDPEADDADRYSRPGKISGGGEVAPRHAHDPDRKDNLRASDVEKKH